MYDDQHRISDSDIRNIAIGTGPGIGKGLSEGQDDRQNFLGALIQSGFLRVVEVEADDASAYEKLQYPSGWDDRWQSQFHEGSFIGGEDDSHPVEGVAAFWA